MRLLRLVAASGFWLGAAACGLDGNGLLGGEDGGPGTLEDSSLGTPPFDATMAMGGSDGAGPGDSAQPGVDSGGSDAVSDAGGDAVRDTGIDTGPGADACLPAEICNNGVNDDCNGKIDCADPACGAWTCTPAAIPSGWSVVEYAENARPSCATGYGSPIDVVEGPNGAPATCGCTCGLTPGSCTNGNFSVAVSGVAPGCSIPVTSPANGGACSPATANYTPMNGAKMQVNPLGYTAGSCAANATVTVPPVTFQGVGVACKENAATGLGCMNSGVCVPATGGNPFNLCILHDGTVPCPTGPGFSHLHSVGSDAGDSRGCTHCSCSGPTATCANPSLTLFTTMNCADGGATVPGDGKCDDFPSPGGGAPPPTYVAYEYAATVQNETCAPSPVSPDGGVVLVGSRTICCQN